MHVLEPGGLGRFFMIFQKHELSIVRNSMLSKRRGWQGKAAKRLDGIYIELRKGDKVSVLEAYGKGMHGRSKRTDARITFSIFITMTTHDFALNP